MSENNTPSNFCEVLFSLDDLIESKEDVINLTKEQTNEQLKSEGITTSPLINKIKQKVTQEKAKYTLNKARKQREKLLELSKEFSLANSEKYNLPRAQLIDLLILKQGQTSQTTRIYFKKFEDVTDDDLRKMIEEYDFLEQLDKDEK